MKFEAACLDVSIRSGTNKDFERDLHLMVVCLRLHVASAVLLMVGQLRPPSSILTAPMMQRSLKSDRTGVIELAINVLRIMRRIWPSLKLLCP